MTYDLWLCLYVSYKFELTSFDVILIDGVIVVEADLLLTEHVEREGKGQQIKTPHHDERSEGASDGIEQIRELGSLLPHDGQEVSPIEEHVEDVEEKGDADPKGVLLQFIKGPRILNYHPNIHHNAEVYDCNARDYYNDFWDPF